MYIVNFPCPRCAVERTVRLSGDRPSCLNCLLRRRRDGVGPSSPRYLRAGGRRHGADRHVPDSLPEGVPSWHA
jgi:hypothetical protein